MARFSGRRKLAATALATALAPALAVLAANSFTSTSLFAEQPANTPQAPQGDASTQSLQDQIQTMRAQLDQLQAKQSQMQRRTDERQTEGAVLADAETHSTLMDGGSFTAGFKNNRFVIQDADGNFVFRPWVHIQFRNTTNWRQDAKPGGTRDNTENDFEMRRARFGFDGNLFTPDFQYFINWASYRANGSTTIKNAGATVGTGTVNTGGLPVLEEAWVQYHFPNTDWSIKIGQMHDPLDHENIVGSKYRAPEASLQGDIFGNTDTFVQAATMIWSPKDSPLRAEGGFTDGIYSANTDFQEPGANGNLYNWGAAGRVEYKVMGNWKDYNQLTSYGDKHDLLVFGAGVDYSEAGRTAQFAHVFDAQYATTNGLFLYASYFGRYISHNRGIPLGSPVSGSFAGGAANPGADTYEPSIMLQASYLIDQHWEPYIRYEYLRLAGTPAGSQNNVHDISAGMNYYFHGHNAKFTGQLMYLPNGIPINDSSSDVLISNNRGEMIFIAQFQLLL